MKVVAITGFMYIWNIPTYKIFLTIIFYVSLHLFFLKTSLLSFFLLFHLNGGGIKINLRQTGT